MVFGGPGFAGGFALGFGLGYGSREMARAGWAAARALPGALWGFGARAFGQAVADSRPAPSLDLDDESADTEPARTAASQSSADSTDVYPHIFVGNAAGDVRATSPYTSGNPTHPSPVHPDSVVLAAALELEETRRAQQQS